MPPGLPARQHANWSRQKVSGGDAEPLACGCKNRMRRCRSASRRKRVDSIVVAAEFDPSAHTVAYTSIRLEHSSWAAHYGTMYRLYSYCVLWVVSVVKRSRDRAGIVPGWRVWQRAWFKQSSDLSMPVPNRQKEKKKQPTRTSIRTQSSQCTYALCL